MTYSPKDIITRAAKAAGILGQGQDLGAEDYADMQAIMNDMIGQWNASRQMVFHLQDFAIPSTGAMSYSIGPGGDLGLSSPPRRLEAAYVKQIITTGKPSPVVDSTNQSNNLQIVNAAGQSAQIVNSNLGNSSGIGGYNVDYPLEIIYSREEYSRIRLKNLSAFPSYIYFENSFPLSQVYPWPIAQLGIYELHIVVKDVFQEITSFTSAILMPREYYMALYLQMALFYTIHYKVKLSETAAILLEKRAAAAMRIVKRANLQLTPLTMPKELLRPGIYNPFSDQLN